MELIIEFKVKPSKFHELYQTLQAIILAIRKAKGCQDCRICRNVEDGENFFLSVDWRTQTDLTDYLRSNSGSALLGAADMLSEEVRVKIGEDALWQGIDVLKQLKK